VINGNLVVSTPGAIIEGKDIRGCVRVTAPNVIIRNSRVACRDFYVILSDASFGEDGLLIEDVEIDCLDSNGTGIGDDGFTALRVDIHGCVNGFDIDNDATVQDSYIHDLYAGGSDPHTDGIQLTGGTNIKILHNTISMPPGSTSAIISHPDTTNVLVSGNLLGGGAYTLYCPAQPSANYLVIDNRFVKTAAFGAWTDCEKAGSVTGNVWDDTLLPVPLL
jgi:hypothetical protein